MQLVVSRTATNLTVNFQTPQAPSYRNKVLSVAVAGGGIISDGFLDRETTGMLSTVRLESSGMMMVLLFCVLLLQVL